MLNKKKRFLSFTGFIIIFMISVFLFWQTKLSADAAAYSILILWGLLPISIFLTSFFVGRYSERQWRVFSLKYLYILAYGIMYMGTEYYTYAFANMITFRRILMPEFGIFLFGCILSAIGIAIGCRKNKE